MSARRPPPTPSWRIKALAHKLARACYHMLREGKPFELARCFG